MYTDTYIFSVIKVQLVGDSIFLTIQAGSIQQITAFDLQFPSSRIVVPNLSHVSKETILARRFPRVQVHVAWQLFHAGPPTDGSRLLGDDTFIEHVAQALKVPSSQLNASHTAQGVKMAVRDRMKLADMVGLQSSNLTHCFHSSSASCRKNSWLCLHAAVGCSTTHACSQLACAPIAQSCGQGYNVLGVACRLRLRMRPIALRGTAKP